MGAVSIVLYVWFNYESHGNVIPDAVTAIGVYIGLYYGLTGFSCVWYYRKVLRRSASRPVDERDTARCSAGVMLWFFLVWALYTDYNFNNTTAASYTSWSLPFPPALGSWWRIHDRHHHGNRRAGPDGRLDAVREGLLRRSHAQPRHAHARSRRRLGAAYAATHLIRFERRTAETSEPSAEISQTIAEVGSPAGPDPPRRVSRRQW